MSAFRTESQPPQYGRRRSNTAQSILRPLPLTSPLKVGDSTVLNTWVHDTKESVNVLFNHSYWSGIQEGDMVSVSATNNIDSDAFLFIVPKDDGTVKTQLQISIPKPIADSFRMRNNTDVLVTKVEKDKHYADYVEFVFQDQYLGRNEMWRLGKHLAGRCIYANEEVSFIGSIVAKIQAIHIAGKQVSAALMTSRTKAIYRSLSAKVTLFIQVCRELWEFAGDGERYNEKIVHSLLPALFAKWKAAGTNHTVTIVLISRVYYDKSEMDYAAGPLRRDEWGQEWYKDFYKVITDLEVKHWHEWESTLVRLKNSFWDFQRDILLTHPYHRAALDSALGPADQVRLVGRLSCAHDGPILEALNIGLNPTETHYIDRSLTLTGAATVVITPGTGYYRVSKRLLRMTTTRMLDQGFGLDLICLAKSPLHQSPIFSFQGMEPEGKEDPLWGGDDGISIDSINKTIFWWEPFWISVAFWDKQLDLPFREDRFIARAKMHEIQMLGLLEHDVLASIEVPFLPDAREQEIREDIQLSEPPLLSRAEADKFDHDIFALKSNESKHDSSKSLLSQPGSLFSSAPGGATRTPEKRYSHHNSIVAPKVQPIEESPQTPAINLPQTVEPSETATLIGAPGTSPSKSSIRSSHSTRSTSSAKPFTPKTSTRSMFSSKLTPWLFKPFRSEPSEPQTSPIAVSASASSNSSNVSSSLTLAASALVLPATKPNAAPVIIKASRAAVNRGFDDELRGSLNNRTPTNTPPREEAVFAKRRSTANIIPFSSSPSSRMNPSKPNSMVTRSQFSLAARWQHIFPQPVYKHNIKWKSIVTPGCLPLTVEYFPSTSELETLYDVFSYDFVVDPREMRSFLVKPPPQKGDPETMRRAWALVVMRGMAAVRLAQGFQFVICTSKPDNSNDYDKSRRSKSFIAENDMFPRAAGASEILQSLQSTYEPVFLSMSNEIHRISYTGETIQVTRYVRRMIKTTPFEYQCLMWPKLGVGYTEQTITFTTHGLENYGWNRLDMLVAGYEQQFNESLRYWRTRFVVIPAEPPPSNIGPLGEKLNDEEIRILGIDKLAEQFTKARWHPPDEAASPASPALPVRFLPTTLNPAVSVLDETLMNQLDLIHAAGPLRKKMKSEREIGVMSLAAIAKAMREEDGVPIKHNQWHGKTYPDSFTGYDFVSWLVREFGDVSSRAQATEWGVKLLEQGLFEHCRGNHGFLDGHYFYHLRGEYAVPSTPRGWFRSRHSTIDDVRSGFYPGNIARAKIGQSRRKRLILSQTMVIDIDPNKRSDQAETVVLHHDIIHNPANVLHFELQWIGTTARYIEEQLRQWSKVIERYGLKLVETYVTQISDIRERNAFQSCFPLRLVVPPPIVPDLHLRVPEGTQIAHHFEYALLQKFDFIIDVEAADLYPQHVDVVYSYRRSPFKFSQFVHRSGVAFIQVLGGSKGFLFLTNRLMVPGRLGSTMKNKEYKPSLATAGAEIRIRMEKFCSDREALVRFYDEVLDKLKDVPEEPPPLSI